MNAHGVASADGALYDPAARTWRMVPAAPPLPAGRPQAAWTGSRIVLVEGVSSAAYDPASNTWRKLPALVNKPGLRAIGGQVVTVGRERRGGPVRTRHRGGRRMGSREREVDPAGQLTVRQPRARPPAVWAGDRLIEWGLVGTRATGLQFGPP